MPIKLERYPPNWKQISLAIRERAGNKCEWPGCEAVNHTLIYRDPNNREAWEYCGPGKAIKVILTVAHLDHTPQNCDPANLRAWCQYHHLKYDLAHHQANAAKTRRAKKIKAGQLELIPEIVR